MEQTRRAVSEIPHSFTRRTRVSLQWAFMLFLAGHLAPSSWSQVPPPKPAPVFSALSLGGDRSELVAFVRRLRAAGWSTSVVCLQVEPSPERVREVLESKCDVLYLGGFELLGTDKARRLYNRSSIEEATVIIEPKDKVWQVTKDVKAKGAGAGTTLALPLPKSNYWIWLSKDYKVIPAFAPAAAGHESKVVLSKITSERMRTLKDSDLATVDGLRNALTSAAN